MDLGANLSRASKTGVYLFNRLAWSTINGSEGTNCVFRKIPTSLASDSVNADHQFLEEFFVANSADFYPEFRRQ